jgi:hypothetical protein
MKTMLARAGLLLALMVTLTSTASAEIDYGAESPEFIQSFQKAIQTLRNCKDCKHDRRLQTMLDRLEYVEKDPEKRKKTPIFYVRQALPAKGWIKYPETECWAPGYIPGHSQDVTIYYWPWEFSVLGADECPNGKPSADGAGIFEPATVLAHELAHCYYASQGRMIPNSRVEQQRAMAFENIYRRCIDLTPRSCWKGVDLRGYEVTWPGGSGRDQIKVVNPCECSPSGENGPSKCDFGIGSTGVCCNFQCYDVSHDDKNCGACGTTCQDGMTCCSGECKDLTKDVKNCGSCGHWCPHSGAQMPCENSTCSCKTACGSCSGYQCNGTCDYCNDPGTPWGTADYCCWCGGDGCLAP